MARNLTALLILVGLWFVAGGIGYFTGRARSSPGCLIYGLMFIVFGILGSVTFMVGTVIGRRLRNREMHRQRIEGAALGSTRWSVGPDEVLPPNRGGSMAMGAGSVWPGDDFPGLGPVAPGWIADPSDPLIQWYWTGTTWSRRVRWTGTTWEPF